MSYYFSRVVELSFEDAIQRVIDELKKEGFGILTEIDVKATLKKKLDVDFRKYKILGACNPQFAYKALQADRMIGGCRWKYGLEIRSPGGQNGSMAALEDRPDLSCPAEPDHDR